MDENDDVNMVSNLPLLFANGYPTSLERISVPQIEKFIPFMVQCSLGHISLQGKVDYSEPEWWPEDIPFKIPLTKPKLFAGNWKEKMKEIVHICYRFHRSLFLLSFCNQLSSYEPARLRFINNYNSTTSLYDRRSNKLLVTFRNENMTYDQPQTYRKCLLVQKSRSQSPNDSNNDNNLQKMVEPALFDIYLCDNCDAELYSLEAITQHEKTCLAEDDDVIICESPTQDFESPLLKVSATRTNRPAQPNDKLREESFLLNFNLKPNSVNNNDASTTCKTKNLTHKQLLSESQPPPARMEKLKRLPRRSRGLYGLSKCPNIALSSPAGQILIKNSNTLMSQAYLLERLDRLERFCHAPALSRGVQRPKYLDRKYSSQNVQCNFKRPANYHVRTFVFPKRQFSSAYRIQSFMFLNSLLLKRCRPISIRVKKLRKCDLEQPRAVIPRTSTGAPSLNKRNTLFNIRLKRDSSQSKNWKIAARQKANQVILDTIDLCSSDEEDSGGNEANDTHAPTAENDVAILVEEDITEPGPGENLRIKTKIGRTRTNPQSNFIISSVKSLHRSTEQVACGSKYEGNFLLASSQNLGELPNPPKPLQPSVYLFSNYTTENANFGNLSPNANSAPVGIPGLIQRQFRNQENFMAAQSLTPPPQLTQKFLVTNNNHISCVQHVTSTVPQLATVPTNSTISSRRRPQTGSHELGILQVK